MSHLDRYVRFHVYRRIAETGRPTSRPPPPRGRRRLARPLGRVDEGKARELLMECIDSAGAPASRLDGSSTPSAERKPDRMEQDLDGAVRHTWYARPVFFVSDVHRAIGFYVDQLGFVKRWHGDEGKGSVCQVDRGGCEIILCEDATRGDRGRLFLELSREGVDQLLVEVRDRAVPADRTWWGYDVLRIRDPDANELLVCLENLLPERPRPSG